MRWRRFARFGTFALGLCFVGCLTGAPRTSPATGQPLPEVPLPDRPESRSVRSQRPDQGPSGPAVDTALLPGDRVHVRVCAWVNGKAVYDDEVMLALGLRLSKEQLRVAPSEVAAVQAKLFNEELNALIDRELIVQDALTKLQKSSRRTPRCSRRCSRRPARCSTRRWAR
jgi:hypothetical protein